MQDCWNKSDITHLMQMFEAALSFPQKHSSLYYLNLMMILKLNQLNLYLVIPDQKLSQLVLLVPSLVKNWMVGCLQ